MVNHPPHYTGHPSGVECIEVAELLPFTLGNAFKYVFRHGQKGGLEDLRKAHWYLDRIEPGATPLYVAEENLLVAGELARRIAAHESYLIGGCLVAIALAEVEHARELLGHLLSAA
ncbi:DUF3310 domain-containing protein [Pseudomonas chloritidismutans]|uniref:DUF3310 domain-containing protein n=2 Tax=Stutzerimonas chloritidismutans TaxID=203192 RepID=A0ACC5VEV1_STUCH|nr:DUF3310 domain-containing protein [Stutzerimonas chloritidismutans]